MYKEEDYKSMFLLTYRNIRVCETISKSPSLFFKRITTVLPPHLLTTFEGSVKIKTIKRKNEIMGYKKLLLHLNMSEVFI